MFWRKKAKPTVEKVKVQNPNFDESFKAAFGIVVVEIEGADNVPLASLFDAIHTHRNSGIRKQEKAILECFKDTDWKWPAAEAYIRGEQDVVYESETDIINNYTPEEVLKKFKVSRLKSLYLQCMGVQPQSSIRKAELIQHIANAEDDKMCISLKHELIESIKSPTIVAKKDMAKMIALRIGRLAYAMHHRQQMLSMVDHRPYWEFKTGIASFCPVCEPFDGLVKHYNDPFWEEHFPPCSNIDCGSSVQVYFEALANKRGR